MNHADVRNAMPSAMRWHSGPVLDCLALALERGYLVVPDLIAAKRRREICCAWSRYAERALRPTVYAGIRGKTARFAWEVPDGLVLAEEHLEPLMVMMRGAIAWWPKGGHVAYSTGGTSIIVWANDAELLARQVYDYLTEHVTPEQKEEWIDD